MRNPWPSIQFPLRCSANSLLLLLLLLSGRHHPPLRERNRLAQPVAIAAMIGENQNQRRIETGALRIADAAMRLDDQPIGGVGVGEIRFGRKRRHISPPPLARAIAWPIAAAAGC